MQTGRRAVSAEGEEQRQQSDKRRRLAQLAGTMRSVGEAGGGEAEGRKRERKKARARRDKTRDERRERDETRLGWAGMGTWGASWEREGEREAAGTASRLTLDA
jgi:hypothetical protein